ncbi:MAG: ester cyclase [Acidobacteriota bacterium]
MQGKKERLCEVVLEQHLSVENKHDINAIMETFAADAELIWGGKAYRGHEMIRKLHEGLGFGDQGAFSELSVVEIKRHTTTEAIIIEQKLTGRHTGTWEGIPATNKSVEVPICTVYEFDESGHIISERPHLDRWILWKQLQEC